MIKLRSTGMKWTDPSKTNAPGDALAPLEGVGPCHYTPGRSLIMKKSLNYSFGKARVRSFAMERAH